MQHQLYKFCDNTFVYLQKVNSVLQNKRTHARNILIKELDNLFSVTKLQRIGPYQLQATCKILHEAYKVQFFIFTNSVTKHKLTYMYPEKFNDELMPIYLYQSFDDVNHLMFIRNLNSYFKANYLVCFECKKVYKTHNYKHLCKIRATCFACRRFFQSESTYIHSKLQNNFCDKLVSLEPTMICEICNCTIYSKHCLKGHRTFCNGTQGHFGFKCTSCNRFFYASKKLTSKVLKETHICNKDLLCKTCLQPKDEDHLCKFKPQKPSKGHNRLCFFNLEVDHFSKPLLCLFNLEQDERGKFQKYVIADPALNFYTPNETFVFRYFLQNTKNTDIPSPNPKRKAKVTIDFKSLQATLRQTDSFDFNNELISFFLSSNNTTFICQDKYGSKLVI